MEPTAAVGCNQFAPFLAAHDDLQQILGCADRKLSHAEVNGIVEMIFHQQVLGYTIKTSLPEVLVGAMPACDLCL